MEWLKNIAPTVASALLGPMGGMAVTALGNILGIDSATQDEIKRSFESGQLTPEQLTEIKKLEMEYRQKEKELDFSYAKLAADSQADARKFAVDSGTGKWMFVLSLFLLTVTLGCEIWVLFKGYPDAIPEIVVGRILGLMDAVALLVLQFHYGTTQGSQYKTQLLATAPAIGGK